MSNIYWRFQTLSHKEFSRKGNLKKNTSLEEQKGAMYIRGNASPNILAKNQNFKKLRHGFADESTDNNINIFLSLRNPCTWKRIFNTNSELSKNRTQNLPSKTTINWLFNDIWCYYYILKRNLKIMWYWK